MMSSMRKMAGGFVAKLLMLFLIITFAVWGIGDIFRDGSSSYAAKVGDQTITIGEFERQKSAVMRQAEALGLKDLNASVMDVGILRQLVQQKLIGLTLHDMGLYVNETLLAKALRAQPAFQNKDGSFSKLAFANVLQAQRMTEAGLLNEIKNEVTGKFLVASMDVSDVIPPAPVRELNATTELEMRDAWIVTIAPVNAPTLIKPEALQEFYEKNKSVLYVKPESRTLEYVALKPAQIEAAIDRNITSQMLADAAKVQPSASQSEIKNRLRAENRERVMHTLEAALDDALAGGATLSEALDKANLSAPIRTLSNVNGDTEKDDTDEVTKTVIEQGFRMGDGETSGLIMTPDGTPLIVHVKSLQVAGAQPYESVARDVYDRVAEQLRRDTARQRVIEVKQALTALGGDKKEIADEQVRSVLAKFNLSARHVTGLTRPQDKSETTQGVPAMLRQAIFERQVGNVAGPLALASGSQMLAIVSKTRLPDKETVQERSKITSGKDAKALSEVMTQAVQARGFGHFAEKHTVKINAQLLSKTSPAADSAP